MQVRIYKLNKMLSRGLKYLVTKTVCGTPEFMAPEVTVSGSDNSDHYDFKADSWSMGVTIFFM
jgi:serine/threonine protein kinase